MKAMILAAGRGERMRPLTDTCPKPLLTVAGLPLIAYHLEKLAHIGIKEVVINHAWLGEQIEKALGDGSRWGITITYSREGEKALETAGGIIKALPTLTEDSDVFIVVNGDVYTDYDFNDLPSLAQNLERSDKLAHLCLVPNPEHNPSGDFYFHQELAYASDLGDFMEPKFTFSGVAVYHQAFFATYQNQSNSAGTIQALGPLLKEQADKGKVSATLLKELWVDVGTPERLADLNQLKDIG